MKRKNTTEEPVECMGTHGDRTAHSWKNVSHRRNRKGNKQFWRPRQKYNISKPMDVAKAVFKGKFIAIKAYIKNLERHQIKNLSKNNNKANPKLGGGKK